MLLILRLIVSTYASVRTLTSNRFLRESEEDKMPCTSPIFRHTHISIDGWIPIKRLVKILNIPLFMIFSRMRSKSSRFTLGSGGGGCVRWTLRLRPQPFATVRDRALAVAWAPYGRAYGEFYKSGHFWRFPMPRSLVSRDRRGTSWQSNTFHKVLTVVLCGRRNTFALFQEDELHVSWQAQHFGNLHSHFVWQARHFRRVVLCVFSGSHCQAASSGDKVQIAWRAWYFVRCAENWRKPRTKHRFWGCKFSGSKEDS